jgi:hypothetical protein
VGQKVIKEENKMKVKPEIVPVNEFFHFSSLFFGSKDC